MSVLRRFQSRRTLERFDGFDPGWHRREVIEIRGVRYDVESAFAWPIQCSTRNLGPVRHNLPDTLNDLCPKAGLLDRADEGQRHVGSQCKKVLASTELRHEFGRVRPKITLVITAPAHGAGRR